MNTPIILIGGGGHAKVLMDVLLCQSMNIIGYTDKHPVMDESNIYGAGFLGDDNIIYKYDNHSILLINGLGSVGRPNKRKEIFEHFTLKGYSFFNVLHPSALIGRDVKIGEGVQVMAGAIIQASSLIGNNTILNTRSLIDHDCLIGNHVHIAPGAILSGGVQIGDCVHIGTGATIIQGIKIGNNSIIGAGAVVVRDVPEGVTVVGVPAREV